MGLESRSRQAQRGSEEVTEEREIIILVIGVLAAAVAFSQRRRIARLPGHRLLWVAGGCWLLGATLTVVETFIPSLEEALNLAEHAAFVAEHEFNWQCA